MRIRRLGLCVGMWVLLAASACVGADFSADLYAGGKDQKMTVAPKKVGRIYAAAKMIRQEINPSPKQHMITIIRLDKKMLWALNPATKEYVEMRIPGSSMADPRSDAALAKQATKKSLGTEKVGGYTCQKTEYVLRGGKGQKMVRWFSSKLNWPIKMQISLPGGKVATQEVRNVKIGRQATSLFEVPKGYKKTQMPQPKPGGPNKPRK